MWLSLRKLEHIPSALPEHAMTMGIALCMSVHNNAVKVKTKMKMKMKMNTTRVDKEEVLNSYSKWQTALCV